MHVEITYNGVTYRTKDDNTVMVEAVVDAMKENIHKMRYVKFELADGSLFLIGEEVIKQSVFIFKK